MYAGVCINLIFGTPFIPRLMKARQDFELARRRCKQKRVQEFWNVRGPMQNGFLYLYVMVWELARCQEQLQGLL